MAPPATTPPDHWAAFTHGLGIGTRNVLTGVGLGPVANWAGLPQPQTQAELINSGIIEGAMGALPMTGIGTAALRAPALLSPLQKATAEVLAAQPVRQAITGGLSGGAAGTAVSLGADPTQQALAGLATGVLSGLTPGATSGFRFSPTAAQDLIDTARTKYNIPIYPGQTGSWFTRHLFDISGKFPGGAGDAIESQQNAFNTAVGQRFGATTVDGKLTQQAIDAAEARLGTRFSTMAQNATGQPDNQLLTSLADLRQRADGIRSQGGDDVVRAIDGLMDTWQRNPQGVLPGNVVAGEINNNSAAAAGARAGNTAAPFWNEYREQLRDYIGRNPNVDVADWTDAKRMYRNFKVIEPTKNIDGNVQPGRLANAANVNERTAGYDPDLSELAQIGGKYIRPPPTSGTGEKVAAAGTVLGATEEVARRAMEGDWRGAAYATALGGLPFAAMPTINAGLRVGSLSPTPPNFWAYALRSMPPAVVAGQQPAYEPPP